MEQVEKKGLIVPSGVILPGTDDSKVAEALGGSFTTSKQGSLVVAHAAVALPQQKIEFASEVPADLTAAFDAALKKGTSVALETHLAANDAAPSGQTPDTTASGIILPKSAKFFGRPG